MSVVSVLKMSRVASSVADVETTQKLLECPVCVQVFHDPKLLQCGHSICAACCVEISRARLYPLCPVCRQPTNSSPSNWPINFGLRDLVQNHLEIQQSRQFACVSCERRISAQDCWSCVTCKRVVCSQCALKSHQGHLLKEISDLLREKEAHLTEWRNNLNRSSQEINSVKQQVDANNVRILRCAQHLLHYTLSCKLTPQLNAEQAALVQEFSNIKHRFSDMTAARLISEEANGASSADCEQSGAAETQNSVTEFERLPTDFASLTDKQQKLLKKQAEALNALRRCETALQALVATNADLMAQATRSSPVNQRHTSNDTTNAPANGASSQGAAEPPRLRLRRPVMTTESSPETNPHLFPGGIGRGFFRSRPHNFGFGAGNHFFRRLPPRNFLAPDSSSEDENDVTRFGNEQDNNMEHSAEDFAIIDQLMRADADPSVEVVLSDDDDDGASLAARRGSDDDMDTTGVSAGAGPSTSTGAASGARSGAGAKRCRGGRGRGSGDVAASTASGLGPFFNLPSDDGERDATTSGTAAATGVDEDADETNEAMPIGSTIRFRLLGKHDRHQR